MLCIWLYSDLILTWLLILLTFLIRYLCEQKLSKRMLRLQNRINADKNIENGEDEGGSDSEDEGLRRKLEEVRSCPFELGDLKIVSLGTFFFQIYAAH